MKALIVTAAAAACLLATPALAQDGMGLNGSLGLSRVESQENNVGFTALTGRLGYAFNQNVGVEGEASMGLGSDSKDIGGVQGKVKLTDDLAAFLVVSLPMTDNASIYARVGYGKTQIKTTAGVMSDTMDVEGSRYGVGAQFFFDATNGIRVDFTRMPDKDIKADEYTVSYVRKF